MKSTGFFRKVDVLGRVVIPAEIRNNLHIDKDKSVEIYVKNSNIILTENSNFSVGMHRKFDKLGRIVIPSELRENLDIHTKDSMEILVDGENIILKKYSPRCIFCDENSVELFCYKGKNICRNCIKDIKEF